MFNRQDPKSYKRRIQICLLKATTNLNRPIREVYKCQRKNVSNCQTHHYHQVHTKPNKPPLVGAAGRIARKVVICKTVGLCQLSTAECATLYPKEDHYHEYARFRSQVEPQVTEVEQNPPAYNPLHEVPEQSECGDVEGPNESAHGDEPGEEFGEFQQADEINDLPPPIEEEKEDKEVPDYVKLVVSQNYNNPFSGTSIPPPPPPNNEIKNEPNVFYSLRTDKRVIYTRNREIYVEYRGLCDAIKSSVLELYRNIFYKRGEACVPELEEGEVGELLPRHYECEAGSKRTPFFFTKILCGQEFIELTDADVDMLLQVYKFKRNVPVFIDLVDQVLKDIGMLYVSNLTGDNTHTWAPSRVADAIKAINKEYFNIHNYATTTFTIMYVVNQIQMFTHYTYSSLGNKGTTFEQVRATGVRGGLNFY